MQQTTGADNTFNLMSTNLTVFVCYLFLKSAISLILVLIRTSMNMVLMSTLNPCFGQEKIKKKIKTIDFVYSFELTL